MCARGRFAKENGGEYVKWLVEALGQERRACVAAYIGRLSIMGTSATRKSDKKTANGSHGFGQRARLQTLLGQHQFCFLIFRGDYGCTGMTKREHPATRAWRMLSDHPCHLSWKHQGFFATTNVLAVFSFLCTRIHFWMDPSDQLPLSFCYLKTPQN